MRRVLTILSLLHLSISGISQTILEKLSELNSTSYFYNFVFQSGFDDELSGTGSYTVFVPSDLAFQYPIQSETLIMSYDSICINTISKHIIPDSLTSNNFISGQHLQTLSGSSITILFPLIGDSDQIANISTTDIICDNGVIHIIDDVLQLPTGLPFPHNSFYSIQGTTAFQFFEDLIIQSGLQSYFEYSDSITIFAPRFLEEWVDPNILSEIQSLDSTELSNFVLNHVFPGLLIIEQVINLENITSVSGSTYNLSYDNNLGLSIDTCDITSFPTSWNGWIFSKIFSIDGVLFTPQIETNRVEIIEEKFILQNPVGDRIFLKSVGSSQVNIISMSGQVIFSQQFNGDIQISTDFMTTGLYFLTIKTESGNYHWKCYK